MKCSSVLRHVHNISVIFFSLNFADKEFKYLKTVKILQKLFAIVIFHAISIAKSEITSIHTLTETSAALLCSGSTCQNSHKMQILLAFPDVPLYSAILPIYISTCTHTILDIRTTTIYDSIKRHCQISCPPFARSFRFLTQKSFIFVIILRREST